VEVVASHGYLPSQFINPRVNRRSNEYNGDLSARLRFTREVLAAVRAAVGEDFIVGMRISSDERDATGLSESESLEAAVALQDEVDYLSIVGGTSATSGGALHIVPPMAFASAWLADEAARFKQNAHPAVCHRAHQSTPGGRAHACRRAGRCVRHDPRT